MKKTNGRIRRWLPRSIDLDQVSDEDIQEVATVLNTTPRKCLGFKTPIEATLAELGNDVQIRLAWSRCASRRSPPATFNLVGAHYGRRIVNYCGVGIAATLDAFLLYQLGYENLTVYDDSMSQWATDGSLPIETD